MQYILDHIIRLLQGNYEHKYCYKATLRMSILYNLLYFHYIPHISLNKFGIDLLSLLYL